jgi:hypothetical protein
VLRLQNCVPNKRCESLFRILFTDEYRLKVFKNIVPRRIFGYDGEEVAGESNIMKSFIMFTLHLYAIIRLIRWTEPVACIGRV